jgi:hypothetical protein
MSGLLVCGKCFIIRSNMGLCVSVCVSFIGGFCVLRLYMWKHSNMFCKGLFFSMWSMFVVFYCIVMCMSEYRWCLDC